MQIHVYTHVYRYVHMYMCPFSPGSSSNALLLPNMEGPHQFADIPHRTQVLVLCWGQHRKGPPCTGASGGIVSVWVLEGRPGVFSSPWRLFSPARRRA